MSALVSIMTKVLPFGMIEKLCLVTNRTPVGYEGNDVKPQK